jgi:RNA polymerase II elongation factor ELL
LSQGIHIGDEFFPTEFAREKRTHEIFSLASNKAQGPLRHYASVEGNILVKRVLNDRISSRVKKSSEASEKKAKARPIQILDTPPATGRSGSKVPKKKAAATKPASLQARNASMPLTTGASISSTRNGSTSTTPGRVNSPLPSPIPKPVLTDNQNYIRYRLIHFLALTPKTSADVFRNIGGPTCDVKVRSQISTFLSQVSLRSRKNPHNAQLCRLQRRTHLPRRVI